jgi:hypothetical protein
MKHLDNSLLDCWLFGEDEMKIEDKAFRQSSAQLLAINNGGMNITNKASIHSSA